MIRLFEGDSLDILRATPDGAYTYVVTDPPYGLSKSPDVLDVLDQWRATGDFIRKTRKGKVAKGSGFMGHSWDDFVPGPVLWAEVFRVCKPGAICLVFAAPHKDHWTKMAMEIAGFEILDTIAWLQAQGMAKAGTIDKKIDAQRHDHDQVLGCTAWIRERCAALGLKAADLDRAAGTNGMGGHWVSNASQPYVPTRQQWEKLEPLLGPMPPALEAQRLIIDAREKGPDWEKREVIGTRRQRGSTAERSLHHSASEVEIITTPGSAESAEWAGWSTQLAPGYEPIIVARRPCEGTATANVLKHGCGAMNIDACRIGTSKSVPTTNGEVGAMFGRAESNGAATRDGLNPDVGRWPKNVLLEAHAAEVLDLQVGERRSNARKAGVRAGMGYQGADGDGGPAIEASTGGPSRFFWVGPLATADDLAFPGRYVPKVRTSERHAGLENIELIKVEGVWDSETVQVLLQVDSGTSPPRVITGSGAPTNVVNALSTFLFGSGHTAPSLQGCRFIIETETNSTTASRTLNFLRGLLTSANTADASGGAGSSSNLVENAATSTRSICTTSASTESLHGAALAASATQLRVSSDGGLRNPHPTLKPQALMEYLLRLVGHPQGRGLDPFAGSGSTLRAARTLGLSMDGIERDPAFAEIARHRSGVHDEAPMHLEVGPVAEPEVFEWDSALEREPCFV